MRKLFLALASLFFSATAQAHFSAVPFPDIGSLRDVTHQTAFAIFQTYSGPPQITCDITTGVASAGGPCASPAATCNGSADDAVAFKAFNTWALANQGALNQIVLTIPTGKNCIFNTSQSGALSACCGIGNAWAAGINNLIVEGTGATLSQGSAGFWLGNVGPCQRGLTATDGCSARLQSVSPGATTVTLTAASLAAGYITRFPVGQWVMIGGLDTQGQWNFAIGFPPNQTYFEYRKVTNANAGTGVITLDRAVSNTYLSTWPNYNAGTAGEADNGGPATIWAVGGTGNLWGASLEFRGLTINTSSGQIYTPARYVTYRNVTFTGAGLGAIPTQAETWSAYNTTWPSVAIEVDKLVNTIVLDTVSMSLLQFQSNSIDLVTVRNSTFSSGFQGGGKRTEITDTNLGDFRPGSYAYGNTPGPVICTRCAVTTWQNGGIIQNDSPTSPYSMSSGVISFANTAATGSGPAQRWASTIGKTVFYSTGGLNSLGSFTVLGVTQDPTNTYIQTDQAGGFPNFSTAGSSNNLPWFATNGAQQFTSDDSTGDPTFTAMNLQSGATALAPMMTYGSRSYAPSAPSSNLGSIFGIGKLVSLTVDVTQAYTGSGAAILNPTGQFHQFTINQSTWTQFDWFPTINLKQTGTRVITPGGVTCNGGAGACAGDTINSTNGFPPNAVWVQTALAPSLPSTLSGGVNPQFTVTIRTDQTP